MIKHANKLFNFRSLHNHANAFDRRVHDLVKRSVEISKGKAFIWVHPFYAVDRMGEISDNVEVLSYFSEHPEKYVEYLGNIGELFTSTFKSPAFVFCHQRNRQKIATGILAIGPEAPVIFVDTIAEFPTPDIKGEMQTSRFDPSDPFSMFKLCGCDPRSQNIAPWRVVVDAFNSLGIREVGIGGEIGHTENGKDQLGCVYDTFQNLNQMYDNPKIITEKDAAKQAVFGIKDFSHENTLSNFLNPKHQFKENPVYIIPEVSYPYRDFAFQDTEETIRDENIIEESIQIYGDQLNNLIFGDRHQDEQREI